MSDTNASVAASGYCQHRRRPLPLSANSLKCRRQIVPHRIMWSWYNGRWWVGCYIWYSEEGTGRGRSLPRPLLTVPNVTVRPEAVPGGGAAEGSAPSEISPPCGHPKKFKIGRHFPTFSAKVIGKQRFHVLWHSNDLHYILTNEFACLYVFIIWNKRLHTR